MAQSEVLELVATAVDRATPALRQVQESLDQLRESGVELDQASQQQYAGMRRNVTALMGSSEGLRITGTRVREMTRDFRGAHGQIATTTGLLVRDFGPAITRVVSGVVAATVSIAAFHRKLSETKELTEFTRQTGLARDVVRGFREAGEEFGVPAEKMQDMLGKISEQFQKMKSLDPGELANKLRQFPVAGAREAAAEMTEIMSRVNLGILTDEQAQSQALAQFLKFIDQMVAQLGAAEARVRLKDFFGIDPAWVNLTRVPLMELARMIDDLAKRTRELDKDKVEAFWKAWRELTRQLSNFTVDVLNPLLDGINKLIAGTARLYEAKPGDYWLIDKLREAQRELQPVWDEIHAAFEEEIEKLKEFLDSVVWPNIEIGVKFALEDLRTFVTTDWPRIKTELSTVREELTGFFEQGEPIDWGKVLGFGNLVDQFQAMILRLERRIEEFRAWIGIGQPGALEEAGRREMEFRGQAFDFGEVRRWYGSDFSDRARRSRARRRREPETEGVATPPEAQSPGGAVLDWMWERRPWNPEMIERERKMREQGQQIWRFSGGESASGIDAFRTGGLYSLAKQKGYGGDPVNEVISRLLNDPDFVMAMGMASPLSTPGAFSQSLLLKKQLPVDMATGAIDWRRRSGIPEQAGAFPFDVNMRGRRSSIYDLSGGYSENIEDRRGLTVLEEYMDQLSRGAREWKPPSEIEEFQQQRLSEQNTRALELTTQELRRLNDFLLEQGFGGGGYGGTVGGGPGEASLGGFGGGGGGGARRTGSPWYRAPGGGAGGRGVPTMGGGGQAYAAEERAMDPMAPAGYPAGQGVETVTVTSPSGQKFQVAKEFAPNFQGFINDYEKAGGVIGPASGGLSSRPNNPSYHPLARAIDVNQTDYGVRSRSGVTLPQETEEQLARKWGLYPGSQFKARSDIGHFEVRNAARAKEIIRAMNEGREPNFSGAMKEEDGAQRQPWPRTLSDQATMPQLFKGGASFYDPTVPGDPTAGGPQTASGERYDPNAFTAAIKTPLRQFFGGVGYGKNYQERWADVTNPETGQTTRVRINDVGPLKPGRIIDLSRAAMKSFDPSLRRGVVPNMIVQPLPFAPPGTYKGGLVSKKDMTDHLGAKDVGRNIEDRRGLMPDWLGNTLKQIREQKGILEPGGLKRQSFDDEGLQPGSLAKKSEPFQVNGTGKLDVTVRAPRGTSVKAEGDGLFKEVTMNRKMSEQPAAEYEE